MQGEEDLFEDDYDEEEMDDSFPDEDEDDIIDDRDLYIPEAEPSEDKWSKFLEDPWPKTVFILMLIGFGFVLLTPTDIWFANVYFLATNYVLLIMASVGGVFSIKIWKEAEGNRLRWGGITNLIVVLVSAIVGTADTIMWVTLGSSIIPGAENTVLALATVIVLFSIYSLWLIQKTFQRTPET